GCRWHLGALDRHHVGWCTVFAHQPTAHGRHGAAPSNKPVRPVGACSLIASCSSTPTPRRSPHVAWTSCCTCTCHGSVGSSSSTRQDSAPTCSSPFHEPWFQSGLR